MNFTRSKTYRIFSILAVISVMGIIFYLSAQNSTDSKETSTMVGGFLSMIFKGNVPQEELRTFAHFCEYALLGFLMYNAFYSFKVKFAPLTSIIASFLYALSDEIHQIFVDGRAFQLIDLTIDLGGIICGTIVIFILFRLITKISLKISKKENIYD